MNEIGASTFKLIRITAKPRPALPRMADYQRRRISDEELEESDYDDDDDNDDEIDDEDIEDDIDDVDASMDIETVRHDFLLNTQDNLTPPLKRSVKSKSKDKDISDSIQKNTTQVYHNNHSPKRESKRSSNHVFCWIIFSVFASMAFLFMINHSIAENITNGTNEIHGETPEMIIKKLEKNIDDVSDKFKKQYSEIWDEIIAGVANVVINPMKPTILFLFSNQDDTMLCLAKMIANASRVALGSDNSVYLSASNMNTDYGLTMDKFKNEIEQQKIVIVDNLLDINPKALLAFHYLCDRENPLVKKAVYIITMVTKGYKQRDKPIKFIEDQLISKMKNTIDADRIQPLITRMTDGPIIPVQPEPDILSCPLRY